jgi:hypothetical protein
MSTIIKYVLIVSLLLCGTLLAETYVIPSVVYSPGANGSFWKTAIGVYNTTDVEQTIEIRDLLDRGDIISAVLPPLTFASTNDLGALFNAGEGTFIAVITTSDPGLSFTARTYSTTESNVVLGEFSTLLPPVEDISSKATITFTRVSGARKALFLVGSSLALCRTTASETLDQYTSTVGSFTRHDLPEDTVACTVTRMGSPGGFTEMTFVYAWGSEADNVSNCPTLIPAN